MSESDSSSQASLDGRQLSLGSMRGVPMVATSPVRHESPIQINPIEVQTYQPPWKALTEYALQPEIDPTEPHFQQIVSQMHGYGDPGPDHHVLPPGVHGAPHPLAYLSDDHSLHQPPSNLSSSHIPGTPSELSSPTSE